MLMTDLSDSAIEFMPCQLVVQCMNDHIRRLGCHLTISLKYIISKLFQEQSDDLPGYGEP